MKCNFSEILKHYMEIKSEKRKQLKYLFFKVVDINDTELKKKGTTVIN